MKKISTKRSKSGFTLLEVMLATVILTIASTMIMKGFIAVMIFANNNKGFARQSAINNSAAMHQFMVNYATGDQQSVIESAASAATHGDLALVPEPGRYFGFVEGTTIHIATDSFTDQGGLTDAEGNPYPMDIDGSEISSTTLASNRYAFFYDFGSIYQCPNGITHPVRYGYQVVGGQPSNPGFYCFEGSLTPGDDEAAVADDCYYYANGIPYPWTT